MNAPVLWYRVAKYAGYIDVLKVLEEKPKTLMIQTAHGVRRVSRERCFSTQREAYDLILADANRRVQTCRTAFDYAMGELSRVTDAIEKGTL